MKYIKEYKIFESSDVLYYALDHQEFNGLVSYIDDEDVVSAKNKSSITSRMKSIRTTYDDPNKRLLDAINKNDVENSLEILKNETIKFEFFCKI